MPKRIFTTKGHEASLGEVFVSPDIPGAVRLSVSDDCSADFLGFGVAITPSSCYHLAKMNNDERRALLRKLYTKEGLGLSVSRLCIGSCDYSPELYTYDDVEGDVSLQHFSVERDEEYVIPMIKEILEINPDLYLFASPWSPPGWMKTGGKIAGGYMRDEFIECYASYFVKFLEEYRRHGIKISAVTPQNEPNTQQLGRMAACVWHPETEAKFIKALRKKLDEAALDVKIWMFDHTFKDTDRVSWSLDNCKGLREATDGIAFHYYEGVVEQTASLTKKYPELHLHFTEGGPRLTQNYNDDWCKWALMAVKALKVGYKSFTGWNLMLDELGGPSIGPFIGICGGLVTRNSLSGELDFSGQYKAFMHLSPYVKKSSKIHPLILGESFNTNIFAYPDDKTSPEGVLIDNGDDGAVAVIVNPTCCSIQAQLEYQDKLYYLELYSDSVSTVFLG